MTEVYNSGKFTAEAITQWTEKPVADQTYGNARTYYEGKERGMEMVKRLTSGRVGGMGYGTAAAALELKELRGVIKQAIEETVAQAMDEKMASYAGPPNEEYANAMRNLQKDNAAHKQEVNALASAVKALTAELKTLREANQALERRIGEGSRGNEAPDSPPSQA